MSHFNRRTDRLLLLLAVTCTAVGAYAFHRYSNLAKQLDSYRTERCAVTPVDFSQVGEVRIALPSTQPNGPHGCIVYLDPRCEDLPSPLPRGEIRVDGPNGASYSISLSDAFENHQRNDNGFFLCMTQCSPESAQAVTVQVAEGSPAWAGHKSIVFGRYWFCGLEVLPLLWWSLLAFAAGLIAAILFGVVIWRRYRPMPVPPACADNDGKLGMPNQAMEQNRGSVLRS